MLFSNQLTFGPNQSSPILDAFTFLVVPMTTLKLLVDDMRAIYEQILEADGSITPEIESAIKNIEAHLEQKIDGYIFYLKHLGSEIEFYKSMRDEIVRKIKNLESSETWLKNNLKAQMLTLKRHEMKGELFSAKLSRSKPKLVINEQELPEYYFREVKTYEVNRAAIELELEEGKSVPGVATEEVLAIRFTVSRGRKEDE